MVKEKTRSGRGNNIACCSEDRSACTNYISERPDCIEDVLHIPRYSHRSLAFLQHHGKPP